jgi:putative endonuclease
MTVARQELGRYGEDLACAELARRHYVIVERRYRTRAGELDIVARDGECLVFVEVKARRGEEFGHGAEAVTPQKQQKIVWMATDYLARHQLAHMPCRFDVVAIDTDVTPPDVTILRDAFRPGW